MHKKILFPNLFNLFNLSKKLLSFYKEKVSALFVCGNGLFRGKLYVDVKNSNFENSESALRMEYVGIPLKEHR